MLRPWSTGLLALLAATWFASAGGRTPVAAAQPCQAEAARAAAGCAWSGPVVINSDHDYWVAAKATSGGTVRGVWAHITSQCRVAVNFKLSGPYSAAPHSVSLQDFQDQPTSIQVEFFEPGRQSWFWGFKVLSSNGAADKGPGRLTTTWPKLGTDVKMPLEFKFPALAYSLDNRILDGVPAPVLRCRGAPGTNGKIHLANKYGDRNGDPFRRTQMSETTNSIETPATGPKGNFVEADVLGYALLLLNKEFPGTQGLRFYPGTVSNPRNVRIKTIGSSKYRFGYLSPMTRPKPCN